MSNEFETVELRIVVKLQSPDCGWIEESIRQSLEEGEDILEFHHVTPD